MNSSCHKQSVVLQGQGQYSKSIKAIEDDITSVSKRVNELTGIKESDTGLAAPALWDLAADKQTLQSEQPLQVSSIRWYNGCNLLLNVSLQTECRVCYYRGNGSELVMKQVGLYFRTYDAY